MVKEKNELKERWENLKKENSKLRIKDCAENLGVSELELLLTDIDSENPKITLLNGKPEEVMAQAGSLGYVMALTRNDHCVHERKGVYGKLSLNGQVGLFTGDDIDLRVFFTDWKYSVAVEENQDGNLPKRSLQFFDKWGYAVHKIHLNEKSNHEGFLKLIEEKGSDSKDYEPILKKESKTPSKELNGKMDIIVENSESTASKGDSNNFSPTSDVFLEDWAELKDTHDFHGMLQKHNLSRTQALKIAQGKFTKQLSVDSVRKMLNVASERTDPIMVFVYNPGMVQIHTGPVKNIQVMGSWLNVMDPEFNLHLREDRINQVWWVNKPTVDGFIQSIEVYDENGELIVQFFGKRKPGHSESEEWRAILKEIA